MIFHAPRQLRSYIAKKIMVGPRILYTCPPGTTLKGPDSITCLDDGDWDSDEKPECAKSMKLI